MERTFVADEPEAQGLDFKPAAEPVFVPEGSDESLSAPDKVFVQQGEEWVPNKVLSLFKRRSAVRQNALDTRKTLARVQGREFTVADEAAVDSDVDALAPMDPELRPYEIAWAHGRSEYDSKTGYENSVIDKAIGETVLSLGKGVVGLGQSVAYVAHLADKYNPQQAAIRAAGSAFGLDMSGTQKVYENAMTLMNSAQEELSYTKDTGLIDPNTEKDRKAIGFKILGRLAEATPALIAAMTTGGMSAAGVRASLSARGVSASIAEAAALETGSAVNAGVFTALGMKARKDYLFEEFKKSMSPEDADLQSDFAAMALAPLDYKINLSFNPATLWAKGASPLRTVRGQVALGAVQNFAQGVTNQALSEVARVDAAMGQMLGSGEMTWDKVRSEAMQSFYTSLESGWDSAWIGGLTGLAIKGIEKVNTWRSVKQNSVDRMKGIVKDFLGRDLDVYTKNEFIGTTKREFNLTKEQTQQAAELLDRMMKLGMEKQGLEPEMAWPVLYARISEREEAIARANGKLLYAASVKEIPELYDQMMKFIITKMPVKGTMRPDDLLKAIRQGGLRTDSYKFSGMEQMLLTAVEDGNKPVTREEMASFLLSHQIRTEWIYKKDTPPEELKAKGQELFKAMEKAELEADRLFEKWNQETDPVKKDQITDQLRQADKQLEKERETYRHFLSSRDYGETRYGRVRPSGPSAGYEEIVLRWVQPDSRTDTPKDLVGTEQTKFSSNHWDEKNPLLHIRLDQRLDPRTGKRFLNVIEVQSDWHQTGQDAGYKGTTEDSVRKKNQEKLDVISKERYKVREEVVDQIGRKYGDLGYDSTSEAIKDLVAHDDYAERWEIDKEDIPLIDNYRKLAKEALRLKEKLAVEAPEPAPFSQTWPELAMKKVLLMAAERGLDTVAIQPGWMQDRFQGSEEPGRAEFYDKKLVGHLLKLVQKFDPEARLSVVGMETTQSKVTGREWTIDPKETVDLPGIQLSQRFKDGLLEQGFSLFQRGGNKEDLQLRESDLEKGRGKKNRKNVRELLQDEGIEVVTIPDEKWDKGEAAKKVFIPDNIPADAHAVLDQNKIEMRENRRFGGDTDEILAHEAGHLLDKKHGLMKELADLPDSVVEELGKAGFAKKFGVDDLSVDVSKWKEDLKGGNPNGIAGEAIAVALADWIRDPDGFAKEFPALAKFFEGKIDLNKRESAQESSTGEKASSLSWFQEVGGSPRASFTQLASGRAFIRGIQGADLGSVVHELGHFARVMLLDGKDLAQVEKVMKIGKEGWTVENEEKFVKWWEGALREGYSVDPLMQPIFDTLGTFLKNAYPKLDTEQKKGLAPEFMHAMQRLFKWDTQPEQMLKEKVESLTRAVETMEKDHAKLQGRTTREMLENDQDGTAIAELSLSKSRLTELQSLLRTSQDELVRLQQSAFRDGSETVAAERKDAIEDYQRAENKYDPKQYRKFRGGLLNTWWTYMQSVSYPLRGTRGGRMATDMWNSATNFAKNYIGKTSDVMRESILGLGRKDKKWARQQQVFDGRQGYTNMFLALEENDSLPVKLSGDLPENVKAFVLGTRVIEDEAIQQAIGLESLRRLGSGDSVRVRESNRSFYRRMLTEEAVSMLEDPAELRAFSNSLAKIPGNPKNALIEAAFRKDMERILGKDADAITRTRGALEASRQVKVIPPRWKTNSGKWINIFHVDPTTYLERMVHGDAFRLGTIKFLGNGVLKNFYMEESPQRKMLAQFGIKTTFNKEQLKGQLADTGLFSEADLEKMSVKEMTKLHKDLDIDLGMNAEDMWAKIQLLTEADLPAEHRDRRIGKLRELASTLGGIDSKMPVNTLLSEIKTRLSADIEDRGLERLIQLHTADDGKATDLIRAFRAFQGYPVFTVKGKPGWEVAQLISTFWNGTMTQLSAIPNLFQVPANVAPVFGMKRTLEGLMKVLQDPEVQRLSGLRSGAFTENLRTWGADDSSLVMKASNALRQATGKLSLQDAVTDFNNIASATVAGLYADDLKLRTSFQRSTQVVDTPSGSIKITRTDYASKKKFMGLTDTDKFTLEFLRFTQEEIQNIREGRMTDEHYNKIIQEGVARTQFVTEAGHNKAALSLDPRWKMLIPFQDFTTGMARTISTLFGQMKGEWKQKNFRGPASQAMLMMVGFAVGAGELTNMLLGKLQGKAPKPEDEEWDDRIMQALLRASITRSFAVVTNPFQFNSTGPEITTGAFTGLDILSQMVQVIRDAGAGVVGSNTTGTYGKFGPVREAWELYKSRAPAVRAVIRQLDLASNPGLMDLEETRNFSRGWVEKNKPKGYQPSGQKNSDYEPIQFALDRGNLEDASQGVAELVRQKMQAGVSPEDTTSALRASLMMRRPIGLNEEDTLKFLLSQPVEKRKKFLSVDQRYKAMVDAVTGF